MSKSQGKAIRRETRERKRKLAHDAQLTRSGWSPKEISRSNLRNTVALSLHTIAQKSPPKLSIWTKQKRLWTAFYQIMRDRAWASRHGMENEEFETILHQRNRIRLMAEAAFYHHPTPVGDVIEVLKWGVEYARYNRKYWKGMKKEKREKIAHEIELATRAEETYTTRIAQLEKIRPLGNLPGGGPEEQILVRRGQNKTWVRMWELYQHRWPKGVPFLYMTSNWFTSMLHQQEGRMNRTIGVKQASELLQAERKAVNDTNSLLSIPGTG